MTALLSYKKLCVTLFTLWLKKMEKREYDNNSFLYPKVNITKNKLYDIAVNGEA